MRINGNNRNKGFTLAELLIVVAIIGVLVAIAIPVFSGQLERSREATDLANVRSAYTQVVCAAIQDPREASPLYVAADKVYKMEVALRQKKDGWQTTSFAKLTVADITPQDSTGRWRGSPAPSGGAAVCWVIYDINADQVILNWQGQAGDTNYMAAAAPYQFETLMALKDAPNAERVAADQATLTALGNAILSKGWTLNELKTNLGIKLEGNTVRVADYYQLKSGSYDEGATYESDGFLVTMKDGFGDILDEIGFLGGAQTSVTGDHNPKPYNISSNWIQYENSLFFSDELASNKFGNYASDENYSIDQTKRSIIIEGGSIKTDANGIVTGFTIYSKAMDNQANMNNSEKAQFRIKIGNSTTN